MLTDERSGTILAAICIAVLVSVAFLASLSSSPETVDQFQVNIRQYHNEHNSAEENDSSPIIAALSATDTFLNKYKDDIDAVSTFFIMVFTGILGFFTISLAGSTRRAAESAAEASNALLAVERGVLIETIRHGTGNQVRWASLWDRSSTMPPSETDVMFSVVFKNYGKTPATIYDIALDIVISDTIPTVDFSRRCEFNIKFITLAQNIESEDIWVKRSFIVSWQLSRSLCVRRNGLYLVGAIMYKDVFGNNWLRKFVWEDMVRGDEYRLCYEDTQRQQSLTKLTDELEDISRSVPSYGRILIDDRKDAENGHDRLPMGSSS